jgi:dTDP-4-amino-4,6-dideoxygalactose transaminase
MTSVYKVPGFLIAYFTLCCRLNGSKSRMSITSRPRGPRDIIEEFWDERILRRCNGLARHVTVDDFLARLQTFLGASGRMYLTTSGRAALQEILASTRCANDVQRRFVLLCSFNCGAVSDAVKSAGLTPDTFDLVDNSGRIDWAAVESRLRDHHHAIIVPHLFGVPTDFRAIQKSAAKRGILVIEDCAQTLGGKIDGVPAGTIGDAAIFSFNYGKPLCLGGGGALLINRDDLAQSLPGDHEISAAREREEIELLIACLRERRLQLEAPSRISAIRQRLARGTSLVNRIRRRLVWGTSLRLFTGFGSLRAALGIWQLDHYASICEQRNRNARYFSTIPGWDSWHVDNDISPAWLQQKMIPTQPIDVQKVAGRLLARGLAVGRINWPTTIDQRLSYAERPTALYVAKYGLDVPIHQEMTNNELQLIRETLVAAR